MKRIKTDCLGVRYILGNSKTTGKTERIYYINYYKNGKRVEEKAGRQFSNNMTPAKANNIRSMRIEGKQLSNNERRAKNNEIRLTKNVWTINKLWNEFHYQKSEEGLKSIKDDEYRYNSYLADTYGFKEVKDLKVAEVDNYRILLSKRLKPASVRQILGLLQRIIYFGFKKQLIPPLTFKIEMPKVNNLVTENLTSEQLNRLLKVLSEDHNINIANLMKLALFTGMRRSELFALQWDDIDLERGFIYIREPKSGKGEKIPVNNSAKEVLQYQIRTNSTYVFPGPFGNKLVNIKRTLDRIKKNAGLPKDFRPLHGLRHVYASLLASSGKVDMYQLQKLLTHKTPQMTQRYAHLHDDALKSASNVMDDIISNTIKSGNK